MPARKSTIQAVKARLSSARPQRPPTSRKHDNDSVDMTYPSPSPLPSPSPFTSPSAQEHTFADGSSIDDIAMRLMAATLNDDGPDTDSLDVPLWKSKEESLRDHHRKDNIRDSPAEIPMDDIIAGMKKLRVRPPSTEKPPNIPRHMLRRRSITNMRAQKVLKVLDNAEKSIGDLSKALEEFTESISREKLDSMQEQFSTLREAVDHSHLASTAIRSKHAELVLCLDELGVRLQQARDLLPETDQPKEYPIGMLFFRLISRT
jgi:hypothetical protein